MPCTWCKGSGHNTLTCWDRLNGVDAAPRHHVPRRNRQRQGPQPLDILAQVASAVIDVNPVAHNIDQPNPEPPLEGEALTEIDKNSVAIDPNQLLIDIPFNELGKLIALRKSETFFLNKKLHQIRNLFIQYGEAVISDPTNLLAMKKYILLPLILTLLGRNNKLSTLSNRILFLVADDWSYFTIGMLQDHRIRRNNDPNPIFNRRANTPAISKTHKRVYYYSGFGEYSKAMQQLVNTLAPQDIDNDTYLILKELHPGRADPNDPIYNKEITEEFRNNTPSFTINPDDAYQIIRRGKKCVAAGTDGLRNEHKSQLAGSFQTDAEVKYVTQYAIILTKLANATLPVEVMEFFAGSQLIALVNGLKTRPIALGFAIRKDAAGHIIRSKEVKAACAAFLSPIQQGVCISNGTEHVVNAIRISKEAKPRKHLFKTDNKNAFNSLERTFILKEIARLCPSALPFFLSILQPEARLWTAGIDGNARAIISKLLSSCGSQQGCTGGSFTYAIGFHQFLLDLNILLMSAEDDEDLPALLRAYIDDGILHVNSDQLRAAILYFTYEGPKYGIHLRHEKVSILLGQFDTDGDASSFVEELSDRSGLYKLNAANIFIHPDNNGYKHLYGINLLGSPIGSEEYIVEFLKEKVRKLELVFQKLMELEDSQVKFKLTYHCFSRKINHLLRTVAPPLVMEHLVNPFNNMIQQLMCSILDVDSLTAKQWDQCRLRIDDGGYGVGISSVTANAAYLASILSTLPSLKLAFPLLLDKVREGLNNLPSISAFLDAAVVVNFKNQDGLALMEAVEAGLSTEKIQADLLEPYNKLKYDTFLESISNESPATIAAFTSVATEEASAYLLSRTSLPTLKMTRVQFMTAARQRLRIPIHAQDNLRCNCKARAHIDHHGDHLAQCKLGKGVYSIHNSMVKVIEELCRANSLSVEVEPSNIFRIVDAENNKRPDLLVQGMHGRKIIGDICVTYPIRNSTTQYRAKIKGYSADHQARVKHDKYDDEAAKMVNTDFKPFIFESRGFWQKEFVKFFEDVTKHGSEINRIPLPANRIYWKRRISTTLQNAVANAILQKLHRVYTPGFHDESNYHGAILGEEGNLVEDFVDRAAMIAILS
jgi:hypothetical protein